MSELHGLQSRLADFEAQDTRIIAVSPDSVAENAGVVRKLGLEYTILSDSDLALTTALGLVHEGGAMDGGDIPRPATFIIEDGHILWRDLTDNWRVRLRAGDLLDALSEVVGSGR